MKKTIFFLMLICAAILTCCTNQEPAPATGTDDLENSTGSRASIRSVDEAAAVALQSLSLLPHQEGSRATAPRTFDKNAVKVATCDSKSRSGETDTLMYVFNFDDEQGFAVIAADKSINGLIAVTEKGSYDPAVEPENPGIAMYMATAKSVLGDPDSGNGHGDSPNDNGEWILKPAGDPFLPGTGGGSGGTPNYEYKTEHDTISSEVILPNIYLHWGQEYPEGSYISENGLCGCTNTAAMIAMAYLERPTQLTMRAPGFVGKTIQLDWKKLKIHYKSSSRPAIYEMDECYYNNTNNHEILGLLGKELFYRNLSVPYTNSTGTSMENLEATLLDMGFYPHGPLDYDIYWIKQTLQKNGVVITKGKNSDPLSNSGHVWIIDGVYEYTISSKTYVKTNDNWTLYKDNGTYTDRYNHINWGWNGDSNGIYEAGIFNVNKYYKLDPNVIIPSTGGYKNVLVYPLFNTNVAL